MPWRARYLTSRRHPLALSVYALTALYGLLLFIGAFDSTALSQTVGTVVQIVWQWLLILGGTTGLISTRWPERAVEDALTLESAGAAAAWFGMTAYTVAVLAVYGWSAPGWLLFACLAAGLGARAWQARREKRLAARLAIEAAR
jgi:hypothetical protein